MSKQTVFDKVNALEGLCSSSCQFLWDNPEVGGTEEKSANYMRKLLKEAGFTIVNEEKLPHAFYAEFGSGRPVIAILGEYDALPGLSQKVCPVREPVKDGAPGHGCGHNLLGSASVTAAIAMKQVMEQENLPGTIRFYGCPEEELLCGKVKMAYYHMFDGCDCAIAWHPASSNMVVDQCYLASAYARFYFTGISSHAAFAPELGRSAMDAVELMNVGTNYLREHVISSARIHYSSDNCGFPPNIVPSKANSWYCVRAPKMSDVKSILDRIEKVARGAAMMTETEVEVKVEYGCCEMRPAHKFADVTHRVMTETPMPQYTAEELAFVKSMQDSLKPGAAEKDRASYGVAADAVLHDGVCARDLWKQVPNSASSDSGDVSYMMPMTSFTVANLPFGVAPHTWQSTALTGSSVGAKAALYAARVIAGVAYTLLTEPETTEAILKEFRDAHVEYTPMYTE